MERASSRMLLYILAVVVGIIVVAGTTVTVYTIAETSNAREQRCHDIVNERDGDRLFWLALVDNAQDSQPIDSQRLLQFRALLDKYKPPLACNAQHIPIEIPPNGDP